MLPGEEVAPLSQYLGRVDAVSASEKLGKLGRTAETVLGGNPGERLPPAGAQHLGSRLFQPGLLQHLHWCRAAEALKRNLQRANAASGSLGNLGDGQRHGGIGAHERFGPLHIAWRGGGFLSIFSL